MHKDRGYDVTHCYNLGKMGWEKVPSCRLIKCLVSVFLHTSLVPFCIVLPKRLYKTCIHHAFIIIFKTRHTGLIMASLNVLVKLLPSSPFRLSRCFFIGVRRFLSASCFYFHPPQFLKLCSW